MRFTDVQFRDLAKLSTSLSSDLVGVTLNFGIRNCRDIGRLCCFYVIVGSL